MAKKDKVVRLDIDVLFEALYDRKNAPPEIKTLAGNQIIKAIIAQLRASQFDKKKKREAERRLMEVVLAEDKFNFLERRRALKHLLSRQRQGKLKTKLEKKLNKFCKENAKQEWVKKLFEQ